MTAKELAEILSGREYGMEIDSDERAIAKENGLVVVYGYSDDCAELEGAINDEVGCFDGGAFFVTKDGDVMSAVADCGSDRCQYYQEALKKAKRIDAVWCDPESEAPWSYKTEIPHETFNIYEDGELFCIGIVFSVNDLR